MTNTLKISVSIPTCNAETYIKALLESFECQTMKPNEVVVSDDASKDSTVEIIAAHAKQSNIKFKILRHEPDGISANYLNAVFNSTGDIVIVGDHDDVWLPNKVATINNAFAANAEASLVASDSEIVDASLKSLGTTLRGGSTLSSKQAKLAARDDFKFFLTRARLDAHALSFRSPVREILQQTNLGKKSGLWFENLVCAAALSFGRLAYLPDCLTLYRQHSQQHIGFIKPTLKRTIQQDVEIALTRLRTLRSLLAHEGQFSLLTSGEKQRRLLLLDAYISFLQARATDYKTFTKLAHLAKAAIAGDYRRFSTRPMRSFAKDVYLCLRSLSK